MFGSFLSRASLLGVLVLGPAVASAAPSEHVYLDASGRLRSLTDEATNRIPDFSHAGYEGGGVPLPRVATVQLVAPVAGDATAAIQAALDAAAALPQGADGFRGAVELMPGRYEIAGTLRIDTDGVVLRGAGDDADPAENSVIARVGTSEDPVIVLGGGGGNRWRDEVPDSRSDITSSYVQVGSKAFEVADPERYEAGDNIVVFHPASQAWLEAIDFGATDDEPPWAEGSYPMLYNRVITRIEGNMVHIDAPVFGNLDRDLSQSYVYLLDRSGIVSHVGIEDVRVEIDSDVVLHAVAFNQVEDAWARGITVRDFLLGGVYMYTAKHVTVESVRAVDPKGPTVGGRKYNFMAAGAQLVLVQDGYARGGRHSFASNGTSYDSGVVFLRGVASGSLSPSEGHHRWAQGLLYDGHTEVDRVYDGVLLGLYNRGGYGSGHGWASVHSVGWNCDLAGGHGVVQQPPTAQNWMIGCRGQIDGDGPFAHPTGLIESAGAHVDIESLYEAQLADRLAHPPSLGAPPEGFVWEDRAPVADAFVRAGEYAEDNFGSDPVLTVKAGNPDFVREVYLRFEVGDVEAPVDSVWLRLREGGLGFGGMRYGISTTDAGWDEATITWTTRPQDGTQPRWWFPEQADDSMIDVTAWVQAAADAGQPLSLHIWADRYYGAPAQAAFGSREGDDATTPLLRFAVPAPEVPGTTGGEDDSGGRDDAGDDTSGTTGGGPSGADGNSGGGDESGLSDAGGAMSPDADGSGCGCRARGNGLGGLCVLVVGLLGLGSRRRRW